MHRKTLSLAVTASTAALLAPATASAHVSFHPNAIPAGSSPTLDIRVPNEQSGASITSVRVQLPEGVLFADGAPPAGWTFKAKTKTLAKPITTDDGTVTAAVTELDFTGGRTPPGEFVNLPVVLSIPDSAKSGDVIAFPTVQTYSNGQVVRWIGTSASDDNPAPTIDITPAGGPLLDVTGGDAGPPAKLPASLLLGGSAAAAAKTPATPTAKAGASKGLAIAALIVGIAGVLLGAGGLTAARRSRA